MDHFQDEWQPTAFEDRYQVALGGLIERKGKPLPKAGAAPAQETLST
jgi:non-homologous end joining protein Ku